MRKIVVLVLLTFFVFAAAGPAFGTMIWNVDFQQLSHQGTFYQLASGPGPNGGVGSAGDVWNAMDIDEGGVAPFGIPLVNSTGAAGPVSFTFTAADGSGLLGAYGHSPTATDDVIGEYLFLGPQNDTYIVDWAITGLAPGGAYDMYLYAGGYAVNADPQATAEYNIDIDGDGVLDTGNGPANLGTINTAGGAPSGISIVADGSGTIIGQYLDGGGRQSPESEVGGFQIIGPDVIPEPATIALLGIGALSLIRRKR